jgi:hypothetical protein
MTTLIILFYLTIVAYIAVDVYEELDNLPTAIIGGLLWLPLAIASVVLIVIRSLVQNDR